MGSKSDSIKIAQSVAERASEVYTAFTNATALCEWLCNVAQADAHEGGRLYLWWNSGYYASGEFISLKPGERIIFSWHGRDEPADTRVKVTLTPDGDGTLVTLVHSGLGGGKDWRKIAKSFKSGWEAGLDNLKSVLETGQDMRFIRRPLLGVSGLDIVTPEMSDKQGLPVKSGLRINGLIDGMGAQAAGLQNGDIIVKFAGQKVTTYNQLWDILSNYHAGDQVKVVYFRDGQKNSTMMELSRRSIPEVPGTAEILAENIQKLYAGLYQKLVQSLEGVNEEQAVYHPAPHEWSVKEVLAHLIATERETHSWIAGLIEGQEADFTYHANLPARITAIVSAFPGLAELLSELQRNMAETVALLSSLPQEFVTRKRSYWRLGYDLLETPLHYEDHISQIRAVLEAERNQSIDICESEIIVTDDVFPQEIVPDQPVQYNTLQDESTPSPDEPDQVGEVQQDELSAS